MAIDTAEKRRSVSGIGWLIPGVTPNATPDAEWRQEAGWSYSGISASAGGGIAQHLAREHLLRLMAERIRANKRPAPPPRIDEDAWAIDFRLAPQVLTLATREVLVTATLAPFVDLALPAQPIIYTVRQASWTIAQALELKSGGRVDIGAIRRRLKRQRLDEDERRLFAALSLMKALRLPLVHEGRNMLAEILAGSILGGGGQYDRWEHVLKEGE